jgi:tetratricopeptide (TPR) repeat protein
MGRRPEALSFLQKARDLQEPLVRDKPGDNIWWERELAWIDLDLTRVYASLKKADEAMRHWEQARTAFDRLARQNPSNHAFRQGLAEAFLFRGNDFVQQGRLEAARDDFCQAQLLCEHLHKDNPAVTKNKTLLAECEEGMAQVHQALHQPQQAQGCLQQAESIWRELARLHHEVPEFQRGLDRTQKLLGQR